MKSLLSLLMILVSLSWVNAATAEITFVASSSFAAKPAAKAAVKASTEQCCKNCKDCKERKTCKECKNCICTEAYRCNDADCNFKPSKLSPVKPVAAGPKMYTPQEAAAAGLILYRNASGGYYYAPPQKMQASGRGFRGRAQCSGSSCSTCR